MSTNFIDIFSRSNLKRETSFLVNDLLTPTERIMLAKRLAIILMLENGYSFSAIERTLKVTRQTIVRFWKMAKLGKFSYLKQSKIKKVSFWKDFEKILQAGLPPRGRGRRTHVFRTLEKR